MYDKLLHIVSFDNVFPPNYGGIIDVHYKCKALQKLGVRVILHCFVRNQIAHQTVDPEVCSEIYYYPLRQNILHPLRSKPFSVLSRTDTALLDRILKNPAPVLFESSKTTFLATLLRSKNIPVYLRLHNLEADYFKGLANSETRPLMRWLYKRESFKLSDYESHLWTAFESVFTLSKYEQKVVEEKGGKGVFIPIFHGNEQITAQSGKGDYVLYHGDLKTADNRRVVWFLLEIFKKLPHIPLVIAAGKGLEVFKKAAQKLPNIRLQKFDSQQELIYLLNNAQISLSWSFQQSGTKVKLLNSLFHSRFLVINSNVVDDEQLLKECVVCEGEDDLVRAIQNVFNQKWDLSEHRIWITQNYLNDYQQAKKIAAEIFPEDQSISYNISEEKNLINTK